jgi:metal-responsive CopG/Arc/MetJ family transcriptional regulator
LNKERVDVRVEAEFLEELDMLAERAGTSRSSVIREAIVAYLMDRGEGLNSSAVKVSIPNRILERLNRQVNNGDATDTETAIVMALDFWLRDLENYYERRRNRLDRAVADNVRSDRAMREAEDRANELGRE